jgi:transcriptional regulator with XRE-family HTH domain
MESCFGKNLESLMKQRPVSARALAKKLNIPYKTVQEWIGADARMPRNPDILKDLAEYFDCSVYYLLFGREDPKSMIGEILEKTEIHTGLYEITIKRIKTKNV